MAILAIQDLRIDVPGRGRASPLNIGFERGQVWGVLGPNGAGKSTLLHTLAGLRAPMAGGVLLNGSRLQSMRRKHVAQHIGMVFQERHDEFPATVLESVLIGRHPFLKPWQWESDQDMQLARAAMQVLDLSSLAMRQVNTLSGGEKQRVSIATVLAQNPAIWLADEPTNHLDLHHQVAVLQLLKLQAEQGASVIMSLHDINLAARWCDRILLLYPNGDACWGERDSMLVPETLEKLYGQKLAVTNLAGARVFVPM